ncbi:MAG: NUDIX hydrolase [Gammaproteobacteria bacterium]|nr:NUDIX hydrolase [Gammaproteobacteria bacterium]
MSASEPKHRNDIYGDMDKRETDTPAAPAATVALLRDRNDQVEVLMLRKNSKIAFGGLWVFPGGRIDKEDYANQHNLEVAARNAAVRETAEEANISLEGNAFHWFAHWTPPASTPVRFATWFFVANAPDVGDDVQVDGGEIKEHAWINPRDALARHAQEEIDLAPPTWVTLYHLGKHETTRQILDHFSRIEPRYYETHLAKSTDGTRIAMWAGDAGYESYDADATGPTHRLVMEPSGFKFLHSAAVY